MLHPRNSPAAACKGSRFRISGSFLWAARPTPAAWSGASRHYCWLLRKRLSLCGRCAPLRWRCPLNPISGFAPWNPKFRSVGAARFFESGSHRRYAMRASVCRRLLRQLYVQAFSFHLSSFRLSRATSQTSACRKATRDGVRAWPHKLLWRGNPPLRGSRGRSHPWGFRGEATWAGRGAQRPHNAIPSGRRSKQGHAAPITHRAANYSIKSLSGPRLTRWVAHATLEPTTDDGGSS